MSRRRDTAQEARDARLRVAISAMQRLRDTYKTGDNRYGVYGKNVRDAYARHAKVYAELTGTPAPSIYD